MNGISIQKFLYAYFHLNTNRERDQSTFRRARNFNNNSPMVNYAQDSHIRINIKYVKLEQMEMVVDFNS